ncbi:hypothetical protein DPMN_048564 [Dreissena polymorpha]|uniref:Uncharacterized protein n=1 Tax=Dreissena polymorpha TaxID=45954 RepID=A0A9D4I0A4_DREPO|nr:hypothetical protein DPMN_048564 [Dreissena polymorpha]
MTTTIARLPRVKTAPRALTFKTRTHAHVHRAGEATTVIRSVAGSGQIHLASLRAQTIHRITKTTLSVPGLLTHQKADGSM